jgi:hypothetical protein
MTAKRRSIGLGTKALTAFPLEALAGHDSNARPARASKGRQTPRAHTHAELVFEARLS